MHSSNSIAYDEIGSGENSEAAIDETYCAAYWAAGVSKRPKLINTGEEQVHLIKVAIIDGQLD
jgi:hypothetical protein